MSARQSSRKTEASRKAVRGAVRPAKAKPLKVASSLRGDLKRFTRERLIEAAMDSFATEGFRATTVEKIVELAGTTAPTFYRHFSSKNDLLYPLQEHLDAEVRKTIMLLDEIKEVNFPAIRSWVESYAEMWRRMHRLCNAYWEAANMDSEYASDAVPLTMKSIHGLKKLLARYGEAEREAVEMRLTLTIPLLDRLMLITVATKDAKIRARLLDEFSHMLFFALTRSSVQ